MNYWGLHLYRAPVEVLLRVEVARQRAFGHAAGADGGCRCRRRGGHREVTENAVQMQRRNVNGKTCIIAINTLKKEQRATFTIPALPANRMRVLFENREIPIEDSRFVDAFGPYATHIYTDDLTFNPQRKEFTAKLAAAPKSDVPMREPGQPHRQRLVRDRCQR